MKIYSVTEFREELNQLLGEVTVAIEGEITEFNISQNRFVWFALADEDTTVKCFMMSFQMKQQLEDGMKVRVVGSPTLFKKGQMVFRPRTIELVGDGTLKRAYELLKQQLEKEGLFDEDRKRPLPRFPEHIGLVTSSDAAAYTDVLRILKNRWSGLHIVHTPVQVQGMQAVNSIVAALEQLNHDRPELECIILTRGGGSMEDLAAFNTEEVARAIFASRIPVVSGVGHERDVTIADLVADVRASTPSNAAERVVPHKDDVMGEIGYMTQHMHSQLVNTVYNHRTRINETVNILDQYARQQSARFRDIYNRLWYALDSTIADIQLRKSRLQAMEQLLHSYNPEYILKRGYSITRTKDGMLIKHSNDVKKDDVLVTFLQDGIVESKVT